MAFKFVSFVLFSCVLIYRVIGVVDVVNGFILYQNIGLDAISKGIRAFDWYQNRRPWLTL